MSCHSESEVPGLEAESAIEADSAAALDDPDLLARIQFVTRATQEHADIYRQMYHMSRNAADAHDLTQNVYLTLWELSADETRKVRQIGAFVYTVALRVALDWKAHGRRLKRRADHVPVLDEILPSDPEMGPEAEADLMQTEELLEKTVQSLPPRQRLIVIRCEVQACSVEAVARELGCSAVTVRRERVKVLATLRELISDTEGGPLVRT
jgi:RNA polymerase sigma-70 factor (ECF subfamily)